MNKVIKKRLGDIVNFKRGYDLPSYNRIEGKFPIISSSGISGYHSEYKKDGEGLITGRYGTLGVVYYINGKYWPHNTALFVADFKGNYPKYAYFLMKCLGNLKTSDKSTVPGINRNDLHEIIVPYIRREFQKPLADCLYNIEKKIELNNRINAELEAMAKTLYDYWFVQFDFPYSPPREGCPQDGVGIGKPYKSSGGKMVWNEELKREIPEGWEVRTLLDIAEYTNGLPCQKYRPTGNEFLRVIKIREMHGGFSSDSELVRSTIPERLIIQNGDVLFSWSASLEVQIWTGGKGALNQHIFKVTSDKYPKSFYYYQLLDYLQHFKMMAENRKTTMGHITQEHLQQSRIAIPPKELTVELEKIIAPIFKRKMINEIENQQLSELRDWLLPMLMNGQVTVGDNVEIKANYIIEEEMRMAAEPGK